MHVVFPFGALRETSLFKGFLRFAPRRAFTLGCKNVKNSEGLSERFVAESAMRRDFVYLGFWPSRCMIEDVPRARGNKEELNEVSCCSSDGRGFGVIGSAGICGWRCCRRQRGLFEKVRELSRRNRRWKRNCCQNVEG